MCKFPGTWQILIIICDDFFQRKKMYNSSTFRGISTLNFTLQVNLIKGILFSENKLNVNPCKFLVTDILQMISWMFLKLSLCSLYIYEDSSIFQFFSRVFRCLFWFRIWAKSVIKANKHPSLRMKISKISHFTKSKLHQTMQGVLHLALSL